MVGLDILPVRKKQDLHEASTMIAYVFQFLIFLV